MKMIGTILLVLCGTLSVTQSQTVSLNITGRAIDDKKQVLPGVTVAFPKYGQKQTTDALGKFSFSGNAVGIGLSGDVLFRNTLQVNANRLQFTLAASNPIEVTVSSLGGQRIHKFTETLEPGQYHWNLDRLIAPAQTGIFFVQVKSPDFARTFRFTPMMGRASPHDASLSIKQAPPMSLAKTNLNAGVLDSIHFSHASYQPRIVTVTLGTVDLGDVVLMPEVVGAPFPISLNLQSSHQLFAAGKISEKLRRLNRKPALTATPLAGAEGISFSLIAAQANPSLQKEGFAIRKTGAQIMVEALDESGLMYGGLEVAEMLSMQGLANVQAKTVNPQYSVRSIKFNTPFSSYRRHESLQLHTDTFWDIEYWKGFIDMMAENRFNTLSLWSLHPFPYLIRPKNFPKASPFNDAELKAKQDFWKSLFALAKSRGIETYLINWNIFVTQGFKNNYDKNVLDDFSSSHGDGGKSKVIETYHRESITQVINEYPDLTGLGITLGEGMGGMTPAERKDWISRTFVDGMKAANRKAKFWHRAPLSSDTLPNGSTSVETEVLTRNYLEGLNLEASNIEGPVLVSFKYNWSHGHSATDLVYVHGGELTDTYWNPPPKNYSVVWTIRNEDFFALRWGEPGWIREHISKNTQEYISGYNIGSETYIPAKAYIHKTPHTHKNWTYSYERQWLFYMQWGRLLYNPATPDAVFENAFKEKFNTQAGASLVKAYADASKMPLRLASYFLYGSDYTLHAEGFLAPLIKSGFDDGKSRFISLRELMDHPVYDPKYLSVKEYVSRAQAGTLPAGKITPLGLADELQRTGENALSLISAVSGGSPQLECEVMDVKAWSHLSLYFADKLRAAVFLETYRVKKSAGDKTSAITAIKKAKTHWENLLPVVDHYQEFPLIHPGIGKFHWKNFLTEVNRDIQVATDF